MDLQQLLFVVMAGVPAGVIEYWALNRVAWYRDNPDAQLKRGVAYAFAALLGLFAWAIALAMGYLPTPIGVQGYIEQAVNIAIQIGLATFGVATAVHTRDLGVRK